MRPAKGATSRVGRHGIACRVLVQAPSVIITARRARRASELCLVRLVRLVRRGPGPSLVVFVNFEPEA